MDEFEDVGEDVIEIAYLMIHGNLMWSTYGWENDNTKFVYKNQVDKFGHRGLYIAPSRSLFMYDTSNSREVVHIVS